MVISLYSLELLALDMKALLARKIICLPLEVKKCKEVSHIVIDIIITFYVSPTELLACFLFTRGKPDDFNCCK